MTFVFTDSVGDKIDMQPIRLANTGPAVSIAINDVAVWVPVDRIEELVAGLRDTARQAAVGPNPQHLGNQANAEDCPACHGTNPPYPFLCPGDAP